MSAVNDPVDHIAEVTPDDDTDLSNVSRYVYVGGAGNIVVVTAAGEEVTLHAIAVGELHPIRAKRIKATGTTATNIRIGW